MTDLETVTAVDGVYESFWRELVETDGVLDIEKVKKALFDFWRMSNNVRRVYDQITGGEIKDISARWIDVCFSAERHYFDNFTQEEGLYD